jgi:tetratricopeptide (TPR) repeat protein
VASASLESPSALLTSAREAFQNARYSEAHELSERAIRAGGSETAQAALLSASSLAKDAGCAAALARFEALRSRHGRSAVGDEAAWNAAECHRALGRFDRARQLYESLRVSNVWGPRARERLRNADEAPTAVPNEPQSNIP